jgi:exopolysaccharide biosynthesis polyprenyl glycosylphosphotransferase
MQSINDKRPGLLGAGRWSAVRLGVEVAVLGGSSVAAMLAPATPRVSASAWWLAVLYAVAVLGVLRAHGARHPGLDSRPIDQVALAVGACSLALMAAITAGSLLGVAHPASIVVRLWIATVVALGAARVALVSIERQARRRGALTRPTLIVGAGVVGAQIARRLYERPEYGLRPIGFLDANPLGTDEEPIVPVLGGPDDLAEVVQRSGARHVVLAFSAERDHRLVGLVKRCHELGLDVSLVPRLYESITRRARLDHIGGLPVLGLRSVDPRGWRFAVKYTFDRGAALLALLILSPLMVLIAAAVRMSSPGPAIFRQRRVGRDGREFEIYKFRTMRARPPGERFAPGEGVAPGGVEGIDRRTGIGRWLRDTSLDELPQLINVLRGEMSLVGPRPERPEFAHRFGREIDRYDDRHRVKSGITGWAQVNGLRGQTSIADRVEWDNHYIQNWSLGLELRTLALTVAEILRFREGRRPAPQRALRLVDSPIAATLVPASPAGAPSHPSEGQHDAFLTLDSRLVVTAISADALNALGIEAAEVIGRPIVELLGPADAEADGSDELIRAITSARFGDQEVTGGLVRPRDTHGVRLYAWIAPNRQERETLVILDPAAHRERVQVRIGQSIASAGQAERSVRPARA